MQFPQQPRVSLKNRTSFPICMAILVCLAPAAYSQVFTSQQDGQWNGANVWDPVPLANGPQTGAGASVEINHDINYPDSLNTGGTSGTDFTLGQGGVVNVNNGGIFRRNPGNSHVMRIGDDGTGTINILHGGQFINQSGPTVRVGTRGGTGIVNVGTPGGGAPALWTHQGGALHLGANSGPGAAVSGHGIFNVYQNGVVTGFTIGVGESAGGGFGSGEFNVFAGGVVNSTAVNIGNGADTVGAVTISGAGAIWNTTSGDVQVGNNGTATGQLEILDGGLFNSTGGNINIGNNGTGTALVSGAGSQLIQTVNDFRVGFQNGSVGEMIVTAGASVSRSTGNFTQIGQNGGSMGTLTISNGGSWTETGGTHVLHVGRHNDIDDGPATGVLNVINGSLSSNNQIVIGESGNGTLNFNGGTITTSQLRFGVNASGNAIGDMTAGTLNLGNNLRVAESGTAVLTVTAGTINHTGGNTIVGANNGSDGLMSLSGAGTVFNTSQELQVGGGGGSSGEFRLLDGAFLNKTSGDIVFGQNGTGIGLVSGTGTSIIHGQNDFRIGRNNGSFGELTVTDNATVVRNTGNFTQVGQESGSTGVLNITNGASWTENGGTHQLHIGRQTGADGDADGTVNLDDGTLTLAGQLFLGANGTGRLEAVNGSSVSVANNIRVGDSGTGNMLIDDSSLSQTGGDTIIGANNGSDGTLRVINGGSFTTAQTVNVGDASGSLGRLYLENGAQMTKSGGTIQVGVAGTGIAEFTGAGTLYTQNAGNFNIGVNNGSDGSVFVGGGASVVRNTGNFPIIGWNSGSSGQLIIGDGGSWTEQGGGQQMQIGRNSGGDGPAEGLVRVEQGGSLTTAGLIQLSQGQGGTQPGGNGVLMVNGTLTSSNNISVALSNGFADGSGLFGGSGSVEANDITIGSRGILSPGDALTNPAGSLFVDANLSFQSGAEWHATLFGTQASRLDFAAGNTLGSISDTTLTGTVTGSSGLAPAFILNQLGAAPVNGQFANTMPTGSAPAFWLDLFPDADGFVNLDGQDFAIFYGADFGSSSFTGGNDIALGAIPEPTRALLLAVAVLGWLGGHRRRPAAG